jgi:hypothetical protein
LSWQLAGRPSRSAVTRRPARAPSRTAGDRAAGRSRVARTAATDRPAGSDGRPTPPRPSRCARGRCGCRAESLLPLLSGPLR